MTIHQHGWCGQFPGTPVERLQAAIEQQHANERDLDLVLAQAHAVEFAPLEMQFAIAPDVAPVPVALLAKESPAAYRERYLAEAQAFWEVRKQLWSVGTAEQAVAMVKKQSAARLLESKRLSLKPILDLYSIFGA